MDKMQTFVSQKRPCASVRAFYKLHEAPIFSVLTHKEPGMQADLGDLVRQEKASAIPGQALLTSPIERLRLLRQISTINEDPGAVLACKQRRRAHGDGALQESKGRI